MCLRSATHLEGGQGHAAVEPDGAAKPVGVDAVGHGNTHLGNMGNRTAGAEGAIGNEKAFS